MWGKKKKDGHTFPFSCLLDWSVSYKAVSLRPPRSCGHIKEFNPDVRIAVAIPEVFESILPKGGTDYTVHPPLLKQMAPQNGGTLHSVQRFGSPVLSLSIEEEKKIENQFYLFLRARSVFCVLPLMGRGGKHSGAPFGVCGFDTFFKRFPSLFIINICFNDLGILSYLPSPPPRLELL